ncbi:MAG: ABC transporter substrate-binding protein, partial [Spirochaetales bacterium]|nr:ABC transporter substrate-binding protein [Spirochaetales bacterium]
MKRSILCVALATLTIVAAHATQSIRTPVQDHDDGDEFVISFPHGIIQLNPIYSLTSSEAQIYTGIYEGLVSYHPRTMEPIPATAQRWEVSEDGLTYTFRLRENARYWNGDPVVAAHFRDTWFELIDPETDAAYNFLFDIIDGVREYRRGELRNRRRVGIRAVNDRTLEVRLRKPATHFIQTLAHHAFVPVHPSVRDQRNWSGLETIPGNGPYRVSERSDRELVLERNEQYWDVDEVAIPRMRILFTEDDDDETVTQRFNRGEIDWVTAGIDFSEVQFAENIVFNPLFATTYYFVRSDVEPFSD